MSGSDNYQKHLSVTGFPERRQTWSILPFFRDLPEPFLPFYRLPLSGGAYKLQNG
jgi:hypothetical protein